MKTTIAATLLSLGLSVAASVNAAEVAVRITNLTNGTYFTPLLLAAHAGDFHLFQVGNEASEALQAMAEGGDLAGLIDQVDATGGHYVADPLPGVLAPGHSAEGTLDVGRHTRFLSVVAMLLPTNDGFVGLDGILIPRRAGVYTYYLNGYDAGTEANDELIVEGGGVPTVAGIPADPGGNSGTGGTGFSGSDHNTRVHVHRGVVGDLNAMRGPSDLDARVHRWLNPVAKVTVTVP